MNASMFGSSKNQEVAKEIPSLVCDLENVKVVVVDLTNKDKALAGYKKVNELAGQGWEIKTTHTIEIPIPMGGGAKNIYIHYVLQKAITTLTT